MSVARSKRTVFDTSVYVAAIRGGVTTPAFQRLEATLPRTYLSAVVAAELRAGAIDEIALRLVHEVTRRTRDVGRFVAPTAASWERAGDILGTIRRREPRLRSKIRALWNDALIALSARQVGAAVVTMNARDFALLRQYVDYDFEVLT
jgi:predicted nucleic acid-binding protein